MAKNWLPNPTSATSPSRTWEPLGSTLSRIRANSSGVVRRVLPMMVALSWTLSRVGSPPS